MPYSPAVGRVPEREVGVDRVVALLLEPVGLDLAGQADAPALVAAQVDDDALALPLDEIEGGPQLGPAVTAQRAEDVAGQALGVDPHEHVLLAGHLAEHEGQVLLAVEDRLVDTRPVKSPAAVGIRASETRRTSFSFWRRYRMRSAIEISGSRCRSANSSSSASRAIEALSSVTISHSTPAGLMPASRARSTAASVWPARLSTPPVRYRRGKMCPGRRRSSGLGLRVDQGRDGGRPVGRRDPGRGALGGVDRHRERGALGLGVVRHHERQLELVGALGQDRDADHPRGVGEEEGDLLGRRRVGRHDEVALVLAVGVVDHDHHLARDRPPRSASDTFANAIRPPPPLADLRRAAPPTRSGPARI